MRAHLHQSNRGNAGMIQTMRTLDQPIRSRLITRDRCIVASFFGMASIAVGDHVRYSDGIWMKDFFSKYLQRRFDAIRFVGNLEKVKAK